MKKIKSTTYYVGKFRLDQENFQFKREEFLSELDEDFLVLVENQVQASKETIDGFTYPKFRTCVREIENKFWAISNKKVGEPFTEKLWSAFFAIYIIKTRAAIFPEIEKAITEKRKLYLEKKNVATIQA